MLWLHPYQLSPCGMKVFMRDCFSFCFQWTLRTISRKSHHRVKLDLDGERRDKFSHRLSNWICSGLDKGGFIYQDWTWTFSEKVYAYRTTYLYIRDCWPKFVTWPKIDNWPKIYNSSPIIMKLGHYFLLMNWSYWPSLIKFWKMMRIFY